MVHVAIFFRPIYFSLCCPEQTIYSEINMVAIFVSANELTSMPMSAAPLRYKG